MVKSTLGDWDTTAANNTDIGGIDIDENCAAANINNAIRELMAQMAGEYLANLGTVTDKAAGFTAVAADRGKTFRVTAASTIALTAAATLGDGWFIDIIADGDTATIDPDASETIDGAATLALTDGKSARIVCNGTAFYSEFLASGLSNVVEDTTPQLGGALDGQGNDLNNMGVLFMTEQAAAEADVAGKGQLWVETATPNVLKFTDDAGTDFNVATTADLVGQQTIWMPAGAMTPTTTNGGEQTTEELATNDVMKSYIAFDDSTQEHACFDIQMPKGWNEGTLVCQFIWYTSATSGDCIWGIQAVAVADDDAQDAAYGTAVEVTDTAKGTANDATITAETSAMTVSGSPGAEELVQFKVYRKAADGSDTMTGDAKLVGVKIHYTTDALTDD